MTNKSPEQKKLVQITAVIQVPSDASQNQIEEWVNFQFGCGNGVSVDNPLFEMDEFDTESVKVEPEKPTFTCPKCQCSDNLEVIITTCAKLIQEPDNIETDVFDARDSSHEWDENSTMICVGCNYKAKASEFCK